MVRMVIGALRAVTPPKPDEWLQKVSGTTSEIFVQNSAIMGTAKEIRRILGLQWDPSLKEKGECPQRANGGVRYVRKKLGHPIKYYVLY